MCGLKAEASDKTLRVAGTQTAKVLTLSVTSENVRDPSGFNPLEPVRDTASSTAAAACVWLASLANSTESDVTEM
jgi:hypothetical protein